MKDLSEFDVKSYIFSKIKDNIWTLYVKKKHTHTSIYIKMNVSLFIYLSRNQCENSKSGEKLEEITRRRQQESKNAYYASDAAGGTLVILIRLTFAN